MANPETILFKDRIKKTYYPTLIPELERALDAGEDALKLLLLGEENPELYKDHGRFKAGQHQSCGGLEGNRFTEKRLCKCIFYRNGEFCKPEECSECAFVDRYTIVGAHKITEYEIPAHYYVPRVGRIDLILDEIYATEVKPRKNKESLLRMIAEVLTYTLGSPVGKYKKAIAFFEASMQDREYQKNDPALRALMKKADITVFRFESRGENTYEICEI